MSMKGSVPMSGITILTAVFLAAVITAPMEATTMDERHDAAVNRQRRIIFNNDGNEAVYLATEPTVENVLSWHTTPLPGTHVDSIFYCDWSSGFGLFTHRSEIAEIFDTTEGRFHQNVTAAVHEKGTDPLQIMIDFCRDHDIEIFWSMRMNDVHDGTVDDGEMRYPQLFPEYKRQHPEYLFGEKGQRMDGMWSSRAWSAVDYGQQAVRDRAVAIIEDVCRRYDIDGVELDYFRHPLLLKKVAMGEEVTQADLDEITGMMLRIREMTRLVERERNKPLLVAVRVPDSIEYCRDMGIDLRRWLEDDLVDLLIPTGYFRLNDWEYSVDLGAEYDTPVYPCLSECRVRLPDGDTDTVRNETEALRGRALRAREAGGDGIYLFNQHHYFDPDESIWSELGDTETLRDLQRFHYVIGRDPHAAEGYLGDSMQYLHTPHLSPRYPAEIRPGESESAKLYCPAVGTDEPVPQMRLQAKFAEGSDTKVVQLLLRDRTLVAGAMRDGWLSFEVRPAMLQSGYNTVSVHVAEEAAAPVRWLDLRLWVRPG